MWVSVRLSSSHRHIFFDRKMVEWAYLSNSYWIRWLTQTYSTLLSKSLTLNAFILSTTTYVRTVKEVKKHMKSTDVNDAPQMCSKSCKVPIFLKNIMQLTV